MKKRINSSVVIALIVCVALGLWMAAGDVIVGGQSKGDAEAVSIAERKDNEQSEIFKVNIVEINAVEREQTVSIRGRTKADAIVPIRAETNGILEKRLVNRGDRVNAGDVVCVLDSGARQATLESAKAALATAEADYNSALGLNKKGFSSDTKVRQTKSVLDSARAQLKQAEIELSRVEVTANATGVVQDPIASVGDMLSAGSACITLLDADPMYFQGQISERAVVFAQPGMNAKVMLVSGTTIEGVVSYISPSADANTRTFTTEIRLNTDGSSIRDGMSATAEIIMPATEAFKISPSWVTLGDGGAVGVKVVNRSDTVEFKHIEILAQSNDGLWVMGLENGDRIITLGQEYVTAGEVVEPIPTPANTTEAKS